MLVQTEKLFNEVVSAIETSHEITADVETTGFDLWVNDRICGVGVCLPDERTFYMPFRHADDRQPLLALLQENPTNLPLEYMQRLWQALNKVPRLINHNIKFDLAAMHQDGFELGEDQTLEDTIIGARLYFADKHAPLGLEACSKTILGNRDEDSWKKRFKEYLKKRKSKNYADSEPERMAEYCERDCLNTKRLADFFRNYVEQTDQVRVWEQECALITVLWEMERIGLHYDINYCNDRIPRLKSRIAELEQKIWGLIGYEFEVASNPQLTKALNSIGLHSPQNTETTKCDECGKLGKAADAGTQCIGKKGAYCDGEMQPVEKWGLTELMSIEHPVCSVILEFRSLNKLLTTYFVPLLQWPGDAVHPSYRSTGTVTGRMSCDNPNLQNIARSSQNLKGDDSVDEEAMAAIAAMIGARKGEYVDMQQTGSGGRAGGGTLSNLVAYAKTYEDTDDTVAVRRLYIPRPGFKMWLNDYEQMEMRVFADYIEDPNMIELLEDAHVDFHTMVAKEVWKVDENNALWGFYRNLAKAINFGLVYGIGNAKLAVQIQKSIEEAAEYRKKYFAQFPTAEKFIKKVTRVVEERGYVKNRYGRRYYIDKDRAYVGVNYLIQGTSADIVKNRMIALRNFFKQEQLKTRIVVQVHDEVIFEVAEDEERQVVPRIKQIMEEREIQTLLPTDMGVGEPSWAQKQKWCLPCWSKKQKFHFHGDVAFNNLEQSQQLLEAWRTKKYVVQYNKQPIIDLIPAGKIFAVVTEAGKDPEPADMKNFGVVSREATLAA
jgi:DNA polymerase-1